MKERNVNLGLLIFRLSIGILMFMHGFHKLTHGVGGIKGMLSEIGLPSFLAYGVYLGETVAPLLLIVGYRTRLAAFLLTSVMTIAFLMAHIGDFWEVTGSGAWAHEGIALFLFGGLGLMFTGAGKYAWSSVHKWD